MTNRYLTVKEERFIPLILLLYTNICLLRSTTCSIDYIFLYFFNVIFDISMYNIHRGLPVTKSPKLLVL